MKYQTTQRLILIRIVINVFENNQRQRRNHKAYESVYTVQSSRISIQIACISHVLDIFSMCTLPASGLKRPWKHNHIRTCPIAYKTVIISNECRFLMSFSTELSASHLIAMHFDLWAMNGYYLLDDRFVLLVFVTFSKIFIASMFSTNVSFVTEHFINV